MLNSVYLWALLLIFCPLILESFIKPSVIKFYKREFATIVIPIATWCVLFGLLFLILRRPWFSLSILIAFQFLLILVNMAKYESLREVFFYQDFEYFTDAIRHPKLYLPFLGVVRTIFSILGFICALIIGLYFEQPLPFSQVIHISLPLLVLNCIAIYLLINKLPKISFNPNDDLVNLGQISFFWSYYYQELTTHIDFSESIFSTKIQADLYPDIVVIQSESFFDIRELSSNISSEVLANYDSVSNIANLHGKLIVPAWGANTVRTECGFLTGIKPDKMGVHRFNPYRSLSKMSIPNLVASLKELGYYAICLHPFPIEFYSRNKVFPRMGFDEFIDIKHFSGKTEGQYTSDLELAEKIKFYLSRNSINPNEAMKPLFIFTMTMENHGPLNLEKPDGSDCCKYFTGEINKDYSDLLIYLKHLKNADLMVDYLYNELQSHASKNSNGAIFCWYGDHVPIMPSVYKNLGDPIGLTDFFIWSSNHEGCSNMMEARDISQLGSDILSFLKVGNYPSSNENACKSKVF